MSNKTPLLALTATFYTLLTDLEVNGNIVPVYDYVPQDAQFPYIVLQDQTMQTDIAPNDKFEYNYFITQLVEVVYGYEGDAGGKYEQQLCVDEVINKLLNKNQMEIPGWYVLSSELDNSFNLAEVTDTHLIQRQIMRFAYQVSPNN